MTEGETGIGREFWGRQRRTNLMGKEGEVSVIEMRLKMGKGIFLWECQSELEGEVVESEM